VIFVTVGTNEALFDRLLRAVDALGVHDELVVQHGPSAIRPERARCVDYLDYDQVVAAMREADVVVTHAGVGSVMTALMNGKRPVVVPRLRRFGEAVDDHQLEFARSLATTGLVRLVENPDDLADALEGLEPVDPVEIGPARQLVAELRGYLAERLDGYSR
jgi:UDP-N-acetylglucosamine transferase subunit ALG13